MTNRVSDHHTRGERLYTQADVDRAVSDAVAARGSAAARRRDATRRKNAEARAADFDAELPVVKGRSQYEDEKLGQLDLGLAAVVRELPCDGNYIEVCRVETDDYMEHLVARHDLSPSAQLILLRLVIWADAFTGIVERTQADMARRLNMSRGTFLKHLGSLVDVGVVRKSYTTGGKGSVDFVDLEELARLAADARTERARGRLVEVVTERITETRTTERIIQQFE